jgi:hypothetical protein
VPDSVRRVLIPLSPTRTRLRSTRRLSRPCP